MPRKKKRTKDDNITIRDLIKIQNLPALICPECARRYIQTFPEQTKCLFCIRGMRDLSTSYDLHFNIESAIIK